MKTPDEYMDSSPLAIWARSLPSVSQTTWANDDGQATRELLYDNFPNGQYFYQILKHADTRLQNFNLPNEGDPYNTTRSRLLNLDAIIRTIRSFYQDFLNHTLLVKQPDIYQIAKFPESGKQSLVFVTKQLFYYRREGKLEYRSAGVFISRKIMIFRDFISKI
jgi:hypothetical protein